MISVLPRPYRVAVKMRFHKRTCGLFQGSGLMISMVLLKMVLCCEAGVEGLDSRATNPRTASLVEVPPILGSQSSRVEWG